MITLGMFGFGGMLCWVQTVSHSLQCFYFVIQRILNNVEVFNKYIQIPKHFYHKSLLTETG